MKSINNNQKKRESAKLHNESRIDMKCPQDPKEVPDNVQVIKHDDMMEFTAFDTEAMTFTKRFDSILNGKHITLPFDSIPMEAYNSLSEELIRQQARLKFIQHQKTMIIH